MNIFSSYMIRCKIKFCIEVTQQSQASYYKVLVSVLHFRNLGLFLSIFSSSESFYFKLPQRLRYIKIQRKISEIIIFLQCNAIQGMSKSENLVVTNVTVEYLQIFTEKKVYKKKQQEFNQITDFQHFRGMLLNQHPTDNWEPSCFHQQSIFLIIYQHLVINNDHLRYIPNTSTSNRLQIFYYFPHSNYVEQ